MRPSRGAAAEANGLMGNLLGRKVEVSPARRTPLRGRRIEDASGESPPPPALWERPLWLILETRDAKIVEKKTIVFACVFDPAVGGEALKQNLANVLDRVFPQLARKQLGEHWEHFSIVWGPCSSKLHQKC